MCWSLLLFLSLCGLAVHGDDLPPDEVAPARPFLRWDRAPYDNFGWGNYENYTNHTFPHDDTPQAHYDSFGNFLLNGYDLYRWDEIRSPGQEFGSAIFKHVPGAWNSAFDFTVAASDGYSDWGYHVLVGDELIARFTPLTLYKVNFNGVRFDLSTPHLKLTTVASRAERPMDYLRDLRQADAAFQKWFHRADDSTPASGGSGPG